MGVLKNIAQHALQLNKEHAKRRRWLNAVIVMACIVIFVTTYALILPAITAEREYIEFSDYIQSVTLQKRAGEWEKWQDLDNEPLKDTDHLRFTINYVLDGNLLNEEQRTISYKLPDNITLVNSESDSLRDSSGREIGTYSIADDGQILITFNDDYVNKNKAGQSIIGSISFESKVSAIKADESGKIKIPFKDDLQVEINVGGTAEENDITINKSSNIVDKDKGIIEYTIEVYTENGTNSNVEIKDIMSDIQYLDGFVVKDKNGNVIDVAPPNAGDSSFELTLPKLGADSGYTITYTAKLPNEVFNGNINAKNKVTGETTNKDDKPISAGDETYDTITHSIIDKSGKETEDSIQWTITVNKNHNDISGYTISDVFNDYKFEGEVNISPAIEGKNTITLPYTFPEGTTDTYIITYETSKDKLIGETQTKNTVTITTDEGEDFSDSAGVGTETYNPLEKTAGSLVSNGDGTATLEWNITINADEGDVAAEWSLHDELLNNQWYTEEQMAQIEAAVAKAFGEKNIQYDFYKTKLQEGKYKGFSVTAKNPLRKGDVISFSFTSTAPLGDETKPLSFSNSADINWRVWSKPTNNYTPTKEAVVRKYDANNGSSENTEHKFTDKELDSKGILKWGITVMPPSDYSGGDIVVTEMLPENVDLTYLEILADGIFDAKELNFENNGNTAEIKVNGYTITAVRSGSEIKIVIPEALASNERLNEIRFAVHAKIDENYKWDFGDTGIASVPFTNKVKVEIENRKPYEDEQTQVVKKDINEGIVKKEAGKVSQDIIPYSIKINPEGKDLVVNSDTVWIKDIIDLPLQWENVVYLSLIPGSLKVYNMNPDGTKGTELLPEEYPYTHAVETKNINGISCDEYVLSIQLPDERPLIVEYEYKVSGEIGATKLIKNSACIEGTAFETDGSHSDVQLQLKLTGSSAVADTYNTTICKVDADNYNIHLPGAVFKLWKYNKNTDNWESVINDSGSDELPTDSNGELSIRLSYNTAYKLQEVKPPEGYKLDDKEFFFIIKSDETKFPKSIPEGFHGQEFGEGAVIDYPNKRDTTDISVIKRWLDVSGKDITNSKSGSIAFNLYRKITVEKLGGSSNTGTVKFSGNIKNGYTDAVDFLNIDEVTKASGTKVTIVLACSAGNMYWDPGPPTLYLNGKELDYEKKENCSASSAYRTYTYRFFIDGMENVLTGKISSENTDWELVDIIYEEPENSGGSTEDVVIPEYELVGKYTISSENNWNIKLQNLPKGAEYDDGTIVSYQYYIDEISVPEYDVSYNNNNGIEYGAITIINMAAKGSDYELPATGGTGTGLFTIGGTVLLAGSLLCGYILARKRERRFE